MTDEHVERLMKRCQIGVGGRSALDDAHEIMAECYCTLGAQQARIAELEAERDALRAERDALKTYADAYLALRKRVDDAMTAAMNQPKEGQ